MTETSRQLLRPDSALLALALVCVHLRLLLLGSKAALQVMVVSFVVTQVLNQLQKVPSLAGIQSSPLNPSGIHEAAPISPQAFDFMFGGLRMLPVSLV